MSEKEPNLIKEFRDLYEYIHLMGRHILQISTRLDKIEETIQAITVNNRKYFKKNEVELTDIKENIVNKREFKRFIEKMRGSMSENLPPLHIPEHPPPVITKTTPEADARILGPEIETEPRTDEEPPLRETKQDTQEPEEVKSQPEIKKRRFPFLRW